MPYKSKEADRGWHRNYMKGKRLVTPNLVTPEFVTPEFVTPKLDPEAKQKKLAELRELISKTDAPQSIPCPLKEESNSRIPELDASGEIIPEYD